MTVKTRVFSGVQPSGNGILHLGNYLGAVRNWVNLQDQHECLYCVVDLHAITVPQDPKVLRNSILSTAASYLACGVDPHKSAIFQQSRVAEHSQLAWVLTTVTKMGWLNRMTQFKAKTGMSDDEMISRYTELALQMMADGFLEDTADRDKFIACLTKFENAQSESIGAGLYMYPVLMAADILLYKTTHVPVGEDQMQHLQLARQIARSFNSQYNTKLFPEPQDIVNATGARIMSLRYPDRKMSKSNMDSEEEVIFLTDTADQITKKVKRATSDSDMLPSEAAGLEGRAGARNLVAIYALLRDINLDAACQHFGGKGFGFLKKELTDALVEEIVPIGDRMRNLTHEECAMWMREGVERVDRIAHTTMREVYKLLGVD